MTPKLEKLEELVFTSFSSFPALESLKIHQKNCIYKLFQLFQLFHNPISGRAGCPQHRLTKKLEKLEKLLNNSFLMNFQ
jgi:hypothetical protein